METAAAAINPRQLLFGTRSAWDLARQWGLQEAVHLASQQLTAAEWSVYEVRWVYHRPATALRSVQVLATGTRRDMIRIVTGGSPPADPAVTPRKWLLRRRPAYPALEHFLVAAPAGVATKGGRGFDRQWHEVYAALATDPDVAGHARP